MVTRLKLHEFLDYNVKSGADGGHVIWDPRLESEICSADIRGLRILFGSNLLGRAFLTLPPKSLESVDDVELLNELVTSCSMCVEEFGDSVVLQMVLAVAENSAVRDCLLGSVELQRPYNGEVFLAMNLLRPSDLTRNPLLAFKAVSRFPVVALWLLSQRMVDVNVRDEFDRTLLMEVLRSGRPTWYINKVVKVLIDQGVEVNSVDRDGNNALMYLVQHWWGKTPSLSTLKLLTDAGADGYTLNPKGESVFLLTANRAARSPHAFQERVHHFLHYRLLALANLSGH